MKIVHLCLSCFYIDDYSYQENMLPKYHVLQGHDVSVIASMVSFDTNGKPCFLKEESVKTTKEGYKVIRVDYKKPFYKFNNKDAGGWESDKYEWSQNPIALAYFTDDVRKNFGTFGNIYAEYSFLKDKELVFRTNLGVDLSFFHNKRFNENFGDDDGGGNDTDKGLGRQNRPNNLNEDRGESRTITFNNTLNYAKTFNEKHDVSLLVGTEFIDNYGHTFLAKFFSADMLFYFY